MGGMKQMPKFQWQERLENTFTENDIIGGTDLYTVLQKELDYGVQISNIFAGFRVLADCFLGFFLETLRRSKDQFSNATIPMEKTNYGYLLSNLVTLFKSIRASDILYMKGYPMNGYALLRDIKDRTLFFGAISRGKTTLFNLEGIKALDGKTPTESNIGKVISARMSEEKKVLNEMIGKNSGLSKFHRDLLFKWDKMFHQQVHGSRFTHVIEASQWHKSAGPLYLYPVISEKASGMFINRFNEICWMILKVFPYFQVQSGSFGDKWKIKWETLDVSYRDYLNMFEGKPKELSNAIIALVDLKFTLSPDDSYIEYAVI